MTVRNNPVTGMVKCNVCEKQASVHQVQRGARKGMLYIRGCDCVINQSTGKPFQEYWRKNTVPRPGYESIFSAEKKDVTSIDLSIEVDEERLNAFTSKIEKPEVEPLDSSENKKSGGLFIGVVMALVAGGMAFIGLSR